MWSDVWGFYKQQHLMVKVISGLGAVGGVVWLYSFAGKKEDILPAFGFTDDLIVSAFEAGGGMNMFSDEDSKANVSRPEVHRALELLLHPSTSKEYAVIVGENGTGKSTAVRQVLSGLKVPRGALYINCPVDPVLFSIELSKLINYQTEVDISGRIKRMVEGVSKEERQPEIANEPMATFHKLRGPLMDAALKFEAKHKCPMVLVIDSADVLAKKDPGFLEYLQDFAKNCADMGCLRIVFISSDGSALPLLMSRSAWSRADSVFEIGEISAKDAVHYLEERGVPTDVATRAVDTITGGLFASLNHFMSNYRRGKTLDDIVIDMDRKTKAALLTFGFNVKHPVFLYLIAHKRIGLEVCLEMKLTREQIQVLVNNNILAAHPNDTLTFHDRHVEVWFSRQCKS